MFKGIIGFIVFMLVISKPAAAGLIVFIVIIGWLVLSMFVSIVSIFAGE